MIPGKVSEKSMQTVKRRVWEVLGVAEPGDSKTVAEFERVSRKKAARLRYEKLKDHRN